MFDYILAHARVRKAAGIVPDLLFVTGDLANSGLASEYVTFWTEFAWPLQEVIGEGSDERTFTVPGNHDVDRRQHPAFSREEMCDAKSHYFEPTSEGKRLREMLMPRFKAFQEEDTTVDKGAFSGERGAFSRVVEIAGVKVGIAGINTAWLSKDDEDERKLTPGKALLEKALDELEQADLRLRIVLGHHPLDWIIPGEQKAIKSLLGKHSVLYLHGHLHEAWAERTHGSGHQFLTIQSGAGFQAREGEIWRNGLVWGEADLDAQFVRLQPRQWIPAHQDWSLIADAFPELHRHGEWWEYPLPGTEAAKHVPKSTPPAPAVPPVKGWSVTTPDELSAHLKPLTEDAAVRFFNGAVPGWGTALSTSIPRRQIVGTLAGHFHDVDAAVRPIVTLLLAPACEGKTTALLQGAYEIVKRKAEWRVLRRSDDAEPLNPADILPVLSNAHRWLLVIDEADRLAGDIFTLIQQLPAELEGRVHFLIACRDSDWRSSGAHAQNWASVSVFQPERMAGLVKQDAEAIVKAWADFGKAGLGDLASAPPEQRGDILDRQVHEEAKTAHGAFFGALLAVRHGSDLPNHARLMLERLGQRPIPTGGTLCDALAYIAAMHAEGLEFLSHPVLAQVLSCPRDRLHKTVIAPLGAEAAATTTSSFVFTRHRRVAQAVVSQLKTEFSEDIGELFVMLARAAIGSSSAGAYVPSLAAWRYDLAEHFFGSGRIELALRIGDTVLSREPQNYMTLVSVANLYRRAKGSQKAVMLFRHFAGAKRAGRGFFYEWGVCEGEIGDHTANALLAAFSISDGAVWPQVDNESAKKILAGIGVAFGELFAAHHNVAFRDARAAVAALGLQLRLDETTRRYFESHLAAAAVDRAEAPAISDAFDVLRRGIIAAQSIGVHPEVAAVVPDARSLDFGGLRQLIQAATESKSR